LTGGAPASARVPTAPLRNARARLRERLAAIADEIGSLTVIAAGERRGAMRSIVGELDACLRPHLRWEERTIHPIVDRFACEGPTAFSATMRYEHEIIDRWSAELARRAEGGDAIAFARNADRLLGVVLAHFELEEQVLFPILDRSVAPGALPPGGALHD
jgi:iron-sulfur cluster repair protein YtfE (RIC family)